MFRPMLAFLSLATLPLGACASLATPTVESALIDAGVGPKMAACMAERMTDRLSIAQLQKLKRAQGAPGEKATDLSFGELRERAARIGDPEVVSVLTSSGAACALTS